MRSVIALALLLTPTVAAAQLPTAGEAMGKIDSDTATAKVRTIDFGEGDVVEGEIIKPLGDDVNVPTHRKTSSLIDVRSNFVDEVVKSVDEI